MWPNSYVTPNLVIFIDETLNGKLHFSVQQISNEDVNIHRRSNIWLIYCIIANLERIFLWTIFSEQ